MEVKFKFEIGSWVYHKQTLGMWHDRYGSVEKTTKDRGYESLGDITVKERRPWRLQVVERTMQQCYGGIQLHYLVRDGNGTMTLTEPELTSDFNDPAVVAT